MTQEVLEREPSVDSRTPVPEVHSKIMGLRNFVLETTSKPAFPGDPIQAQEYPVGAEAGVVPDEVMGAEDIDAINQASSALVKALADPDEMHIALDSLLAVEVIRRADYDLGQDTSMVGQELDENGARYLDILFDSGDKLASLKALSLIYGRPHTDEASHANIERYWPQVIALSDPDTRTPESKAFYENLLEAISSGGMLFGSFMRNAGYENPYGMERKWQMTECAGLGKAITESDRTTANIRSMIHLERIEAGLSKKITDTFNITNFARYDPQMLAEMYRARVEEPDKPYVLGIAARGDHTGSISSYSNANNRRIIQEKLAKRGVRFEEHECESNEDVIRVIQGALELQQTHGAQITDVLIDGHGNPNSIILGSEGYDGQLTACYNGYLSTLTPALNEDARVIVRSCSAGKEKDGSISVARSIAQKVGREVVASKVDAANELKVKVKQGSPRMDARFDSPKHMVLVLPVALIPFVGDKMAYSINKARIQRTYEPREPGSSGK